MRLPFRKRPDVPPASSLEGELVRFVGMMVHELGHQVARLRNLAYLIRREPEIRSGRVLRRLDDLARTADELASGLKIMRSIGAVDETTPCDFIADVLEPCSFFLRHGRYYTRLRVDSSARRIPPVRLRAGAAVLALARLLALHQAETAKCMASRGDRTATFTLELFRGLGYEDSRRNRSTKGLLREAGFVSFRFNPESGNRLMITLEVELDQ